MNIFDVENLFAFIGGLGMFLYGTHIMSESMQRVFGNSSKNYLQALTSNPFMGILVGIVVTIITHSSAATTVMIIGFVNAGLMTLNQAVGVIMGANIGTTATAWLVSLMEFGETSKLMDPSFYAPLVLGVSAILLVFSKKDKFKNSFSVIVGVGFLFVGLSSMSLSVKPYHDAPLLINAFSSMSNNPFLGLMLGLFVTALLQSSTASMSILQALTVTGVVTKNAAIFIILGQNIGTCVTALLSSLSASKNAKKTALIHLMFNVLGAVICTAIILITYPLTHNFLLTKITLIEISVFHSCFNIGNTVVLFPFANQLIKLINFIVKDDANDENNILYSDRVKKRLDERTLAQPILAFDTANHVVVSYAKFVLNNLKRAVFLILENKNEEMIEQVYKDEEEIDKSNYSIVDYLAKLNTKSLNNEQHKYVEAMMSMCSDIERIGDHSENLAENAEGMYKDNITFTDEALAELKEMCQQTVESVEYAIDCVENNNVDSINKVREREQKVDEMKDALKENHIRRLNESKCNTRSGVIFFEIITNLERVSDHANNLADYILDLNK